MHCCQEESWDFTLPAGENWQETYSGFGGIFACLPASILLPFRIFLFAFWLAVVIWSILDWTVSYQCSFLSWTAYATHWAATIELVYFGLLVLTTYCASSVPAQEARGFRQGAASLRHSPPAYAKVTWALGTLMNGGALSIALQFWTVVFPFEEGGPYLISPFTHGSNYILVLLDCLSTRQPLYFKHVWTIMAFSVVYPCFNAAYILLGGRGADPNQDYIYGIMDWYHKPMLGIIICTVNMAVGSPVLHAFQCLIWKASRWLGTRISRSSVADRQDLRTQDMRSEVQMTDVVAAETA